MDPDRVSTGDHADMKTSFAGAAAGIAALFSGLATLATLLNMRVDTDFERWMLSTAVDVTRVLGLNFRMAPLFVIAGGVALIAAVVTLILFMRLEIVAAGWAADRSSQALKKRNGELSVEEEMRALVKRFGRG